MQKVEKQILPTKAGQIVVIMNPMPDEDPTTQYIVAEEPALYPVNRKILLYSITEVQRTQATGGIPFGTSVEIKDLHVVSQDLKSWIEDWNHFME